MATHLTVALAVLSVLTVMPSPDMAIVTRRALADGPADALRTSADALRTSADALRTVAGAAAGLPLRGALTAAGRCRTGSLTGGPPGAPAAGRRLPAVPGCADPPSDPPGRPLPPLAGTGTGTDRHWNWHWHRHRGAVRQPVADRPDQQRPRPEDRRLLPGPLPALTPPHLPAAWVTALLVLLHTTLTLAWLGSHALPAGRSAAAPPPTAPDPPRTRACHGRRPDRFRPGDRRRSPLTPPHRAPHPPPSAPSDPSPIPALAWT
ncbi:hypothetical protein SGLAM104S_08358 [Streptomyces glaucescens]